MEQPPEVQCTSGVRARIQEVESEDMRLGPATYGPLSIMRRRKPDGEDSRVCALDLEHIVSYTVNIRGPCLDKAVGQPLHVPYLVPFSIPIFLIVVSEHCGPGDLPLGDNLRKFSQDGFCVP